MGGLREQARKQETETEMTDGLDRFAQLKAMAAETCGTTTDDARIELMAAVRLAFERQVEALAAGQRIDYTAFTRTVEMLDKYAPPPKLEAKLVVMHKNYDVPARPQAPAPEKSTGDAPTENAKPSTAAPNVTPLPTRLGVSASSFHDAVLPNGEYAPLKRFNGEPRVHPHSHFGPGVLDEPTPDWSAIHKPR